VRARGYKKGEVYWAHSQAKKRRAGGRQAAAGGRWRAWRLRRAARAMHLREEEPAGSVKRRAGELGPGGVGRAAKG
jgi:hypothetical protein